MFPRSTNSHFVLSPQPDRVQVGCRYSAACREWVQNLVATVCSECVSRCCWRITTTGFCDYYGCLAAMLSTSHSVVILMFRYFFFRGLISSITRSVFAACSMLMQIYKIRWEICQPLPPKIWGPKITDSWNMRVF